MTTATKTAEDQTAHTPGPWWLRQDHTPADPYGHYHHTIEAGHGYSGNGFNLGGIVSPADARLIAAAPDLLEALRWIAECAAADGNADIEREALAAIAKASSRTPFGTSAPTADEDNGHGTHQGSTAFHR